MSHVTLVLPFSLPPKELAPEMARHVAAPSLATLVSKTASEQVVAGPGSVRQLSHELWLARALGGSEPAFAHAAMRGAGTDPGDGHWFIVHPAHIEIARSHLLLNDVRQLGLTEAHSRALFETARPYFEESGYALAYADAATWFLRADEWRGLHTASPDAAAGLDISFFMPEGPAAARFRKLQNEIQMLWHEHPANLERAAKGQAAVNAFWPWAANGNAADMPTVIASGAQPWLNALAAGTGGGVADAATAFAGSADRIVYCDQFSAPAIAGDWSAWIHAMNALENEWFAPALAALKAGAVERVSVVLSGRDSLLQTTATRLSQRKFWRRTTLDRLFK
jgi:hypothetical protein